MAIAPEIEETDKGIAEDVAKILQAQTEVPADSVKAGVHKGIVTLTGEVDDEFERLDLEKKIEEVKGIKFIENDITIRKHGMAAHDEREAPAPPQVENPVPAHMDQQEAKKENDSIFDALRKSQISRTQALSYLIGIILF